MRRRSLQQELRLRRRVQLHRQFGSRRSGRFQKSSYRSRAVVPDEKSDNGLNPIQTKRYHCSPRFRCKFTLKRGSFKKRWHRNKNNPFRRPFHYNSARLNRPTSVPAASSVFPRPLSAWPLSAQLLSCHRSTTCAALPTFCRRWRDMGKQPKRNRKYNSLQVRASLRIRGDLGFLVKVRVPRQDWWPS